MGHKSHLNKLKIRNSTQSVFLNYNEIKQKSIPERQKMQNYLEIKSHIFNNTCDKEISGEIL